jgi:hypothetical protein
MEYRPAWMFFQNACTLGASGRMAPTPTMAMAVVSFIMLLFIFIIANRFFYREAIS